MAEFKPINLAQLYQGADASVAQAMQTNLFALQLGRAKREFEVEDQLRTLARGSVVTDATTGDSSFDLKGFAKGAMGIDPMKGMAFQSKVAEAEKATLERTNLQGQIDERRMKQAGERLRVMNEASTVPYLKYKELVDGGMPEADARRQVQPLHEQGFRQVVESGIFTAEQLQKLAPPEQFDPARAEAGMRYVLGAKEQLAEYWQGKNFAAGKKRDDETRRHHRVTEGQGATRITQDQWTVDSERGLQVNKVTGETKPLQAPAGQGALPPKSSDVEGLRKEFNNREEVKNYNAAVPVLRSITTAKNTPAGDLDFIYGVGKILDPNSVVREGEMALVIKSGSPLERVLGTTNWVGGEGKLTPKVREDLLGMLHGRVNELKSAAEDAKKPFEAQAKRQNIPVAETLTLPDLPKLPDRRGAGKAGKAVAPVKITDEAGYAKLAPGTRYIDPDGVERTKGGG